VRHCAFVGRLRTRWRGIGAGVDIVSHSGDRQLATWLHRPPDTQTDEDLRRYQIEQSETGLGAPAMNTAVSALRFFYTRTLDRPDLTRMLLRIECGKPVLSLSKGADGTAMPYSRPICWCICASGGKLGAIKASCTPMAGCSPASIISGRSATGRSTVSRPRQRTRVPVSDQTDTVAAKRQCAPYSSDRHRLNTALAEASQPPYCQEGQTVQPYPKSKTP